MERIGVFVCHCGTNIAGTVDVEKVAEELGVQGVLPEAEEIMAARDIVIAETNELKTHICHISTKTSKNMIRDAKKRGVKITCETCPHYFTFTVEEVLKSGSNAKMNPPLREEKDRLAIIEGLKDTFVPSIEIDPAKFLDEYIIKDGKKIHDWLLDLRDYRNKVDYNSQNDFNLEFMAKQSKVYSKKIFDTINNF